MRKIQLITAIFIIIFLFLTSCKDNVEITGTVKKVYEGGVKDLIFELEEHDDRYYINRGLEGKFNLNEIEQDLLGKNITIQFRPSSSILITILGDSENKSHHITKLSSENKIIYNE